jgi:alanine racemase
MYFYLVNLNYSTKDIAEKISADYLGAVTFMIHAVHIDTRQMHEGNNTLFFCLEAKRSGLNYIESAYNKGCRAFVVPKKYMPDEMYQDAVFLKVENVLLALQLLAKKHRAQFSYPVIGITGSFGKTIVKEWLFHFLQDDFKIVRSPKSYNSQIGVALSVLQMSSSHNLAIFEAGISQVGEMQRLQQIIQPTLGVFTGLGAAHSEGFANDEQKLHEKAQLFKECPAVISEKENFSNTKNLHWDEIVVLPDQGNAQLHVPDFGKFSVPFIHKHKLHNLSVVLRVLKALHHPTSKVQSKIDQLPQIAMRLELIKGKNNNTIINDAYALEGLTEAIAFAKELRDKKPLLVCIGIKSSDFLQSSQYNDLKCSEHQVYFVADHIKHAEIIDFQQAAKFLSEVSNSVVLFKGQHGSGVAKLITPLMEKTHDTVVEISRSALRNNLTRFTSFLKPSTKMMVMIKAAAYGVGANEMADFLQKEGVDFFGVAFPDEGVTLRKRGVSLPIMVMNTNEAAFADILEHQLQPAIFSLKQLDAFTTNVIRAGISSYPIHIKLETGMNRLGFAAHEIPQLCLYLNNQPEIKVAGVYSHLAESGSADATFTLQQLQRFRDATLVMENALGYPFAKHICNTDGIINYPEAHFDMVRLGIGVFGYASSDGLEHAVSIKTKISKVNHLVSGNSLGYDRSFVATKETQVAVLPIGYADGFRRLFGNGLGHVFIQGKACKVLGNVCMDMCFVDVTGLNVSAGEEVELLGANVTIYDWATWAQTIPYEVLTSLSMRLSRVWVE